MFSKTLTKSLLMLLAAASASAFGFEIDKNWEIVSPENAVPTERKAAQDVAKYIQKISGIDLKIVSKGTGKKAIIVRKNTSLPEEGWDVKAVPEGLLISGGVPNGMLYAANEFIERGLGCRFLAYDITYIPKKAKIVIPDNFKCSGKPCFDGRSIYRGWTSGSTEFNVQSKLNGGIYAGPEYGWYDRVVDNQGCHTFYLYSSKFPEDKPEWLSLNTDGRRLRGVKGNGPGQLCLTQKDSRDFIFNEMVKRINREREELKKAGRPYSKVIDVSANDNNLKCVCPTCMAAAKKYGGYSGVLLEFINDLAERLEKVFPGMMVQTFAYEFSETAPKNNNIAPRKNVIMHVALLGGEYYSVTDVQRDSLRPLDHPNNKKALQRIKEWTRYGTPIRMWDYWVLYDQRRNFPYTVIPSLAPNLRFYAKNNVSRVFGESEIVMGNRLVCGRSFLDLTHYLAFKLLTDPFQDDKAVIADFMKHYYGPAAKPMSLLLDHLCKAMETETANIGKVGIGVRYLTKEFFEDSLKLFAEAEELAKNDPAILDRIGQERIVYDEAMLDLESKVGLKIDRKTVLERYRKNYKKAFYRYGNENFIRKYEKALAEHLDLMGRKVDIPAQFAGKRVYDFPVITVMKQERMYTKVIDDPEAAGGKADVLTGKGTRRGTKWTEKDFHGKPFEFGVYSPTTKKFNLTKRLTADETFRDEKYHWYYMGKTRLAPDSFIWVHWSWRMSLKCAATVYNPVMPEAEYGIWLSAKLVGPEYAPGSKKPNAVYVDRVIITKE